MNSLIRNRRTLALILLVAALLALFGFAAMRSGPLAPIPVTTTVVVEQVITPSLFGIGTVEARFTFLIGPTAPGRIQTVAVDVNDRVGAGQQLVEMDPVDLDARIDAQTAALRRAEAEVHAAKAILEDAAARRHFAAAQASRYDQLFNQKVASAETADARHQDHQSAEANYRNTAARLEIARREVARMAAERDVLIRQRVNLRLVAPADGLVTARHADPGTTMVAGQAVVEMVDPDSIWINVRFDQIGAAGLESGLPAEIVLRSRAGIVMTGRVARVEPVADAVTEELLAKVVFDPLPQILPPIGELAEVTVVLPLLTAAPVVPNAAVKRVNGRLGVWVVEQNELHFTPVRIGLQDLDGRVQILGGLKSGQQVVVYTQQSLTARSRFKVVERLPGVSP